MELLRSVNISTRVSLVVCLIDGFTTKQKSGGNINVLLQDCPQKPIRKSDGYYVFTNLSKDIYNIIIQSDVYIDESVAVAAEHINPAEPVVYITLKPGPAYPFPVGTTLIRGAVRASSGGAIQGAAVEAVVTSRDCARARLVRDGAKKGNREICLGDVSGIVAVGDSYQLAGKDGETAEICRVAGMEAKAQCYRLERSLQHNHQGGALLMPVVTTVTDQKGEYVLYFRNCVKNFSVNLNINYNNNSFAKEVSLDEGVMAYLGVVEL